MSEIKTPDNIAEGAQSVEAAMDIFEKALQDELDKLKNCQQNSGVDTCFVCEKMLECPTRKSYVSAVYKSMSKGEARDFDF